ILSPDGRQVLLIHRNRRPDDAHFGKYNGLGGKLDPGEDIITCLRREIRGGSGLEGEEMLLAGGSSWPGVGEGGGGWFGFIFRIERFSGTPRACNPEGTLEWVTLERLLELPLWEGDHFFLPLVFARPLRMFHGVMPYRDGRPVSWSYSTL